MDYSKVLEFIYGLQKHGVKLGLERIRLIAGLLGNPHNSYSSVHIAGTNGKGSVSAIICSIINSAGFKTGLFTSPHILSFTERIRVDKAEITEQEVIQYAHNIRHVLEKNRIEGTTFFEFVTALAMLYFADRSVQCGVFETGMGGRLDATNILNPEVSVITRIGLDHQEFLGETLAKIAFEKAGIIKPNIPVVCSCQLQDAMDVLSKRAQLLNAPMYIYGRDFSARLNDSSLKGISFDFTGPLNIENLFLPLSGNHQSENAATAIMCCCLYLAKLFSQRELEGIIRKGLADTVWPGRLQFLSGKPQILIDGAHNPEAAQSLAFFIKSHLSMGKIIFVIGIMSDKDAPGILNNLLPLADKTIFASPKYDRAASPNSLLEIARKIGFDNAETATSIKEALHRAFSLCNSTFSDYKLINVPLSDNLDPHEPLIVITGSFYVLGEALEAMGAVSALGNLRETMSAHYQ